MTQFPTRNSQIAERLEDSYTILDFSRNTSPGTQTLSHLPTPTPMSTAHQSAHPSVQPESLHVDPVIDETPGNTLNTATTQEDADAIKIVTAINKRIQSHTSTPK